MQQNKPHLLIDIVPSRGAGRIYRILESQNPLPADTREECPMAVSNQDRSRMLITGSVPTTDSKDHATTSKLHTVICCYKRRFRPYQIVAPWAGRARPNIGSLSHFFARCSARFTRRAPAFIGTCRHNTASSLPLQRLASASV